MAERGVDPAVLSALARRMLARRIRILLVDGPSGAGKSTLASGLAAGLRRRVPVTLLRMDSFYPGWGGLERGSRIAEDLLLAVRRRVPAHYREWNWGADTAGARRLVDPRGVLILEGCGSSTALSRRRADYSVWVDAADPVRKWRALARDGDTFASHWDGWDEQFRRHVLRNDPRGSADDVIRMD